MCLDQHRVRGGVGAFGPSFFLTVLLWILFVFCASYLSLLCCLVCSLRSCCRLLGVCVCGGADLMALLGVAFVTFPYGVPSQMWNLTVSNPDLCLLHY